MSGNESNYYYATGSPYHADYSQQWAWSQNAQYNYMAANYMRNAAYAHYNSNAHNTTTNSTASHTGPTNSTTTTSSDTHSRTGDGVNMSRSQNMYMNQQNFYNRPYNNFNRFGNRNLNGVRDFSQPPPPLPYGNYNRQRNFNKRPMQEVIDNKSKSKSKKKKSLSENTPKLRDWSLEDAQKALAVEKEYNKVYRNHSLIIKFPDPELNKEIVSKFHSKIENVHFQQPSTARFCFVTLTKDADADSVITDINKIKFGEGYLTAEYKKDREEDQHIGPEDIDPFTLYVGNLAQEVTKEDMTSTFPKCKRIDIGYAKKMKYTRYAFVGFRKVDDTIEAFKSTRCTEMYSKSLIVRFRRLKGTVGMPGESKPQNPPRTRNDSSSVINLDESNVSVNNGSSWPHNLLDTTDEEGRFSPESNHDDDQTLSKDWLRNNIDIGLEERILNQEEQRPQPRIPQLPIKEEPEAPVKIKTEPNRELNSEDVKPDISRITIPANNTAALENPDDLFRKHRPMVKKEVKKETEKEQSKDDDISNDPLFASLMFSSGIEKLSNSNANKSQVSKPTSSSSSTPKVKEEPNGSDLLNVTVKMEPDDGIGIEYNELGPDDEDMDEINYNAQMFSRSLGLPDFSKSSRFGF